MEKDDRENFERRAQTVIQLIITGLLVWFGITTVNTSTAVARLEERISYAAAAQLEMKQTIQALQIQVTNSAIASATAANSAAIAAAIQKNK